MPRTHARFSFAVKLGVAVLLVAALDRLWQGTAIGSWFGGWAAAWAALLAVARPALRRGAALVAWACAIAMAGVLAFDPGWLAWLLSWSALSIAALLPRTAGFDDAWRWALRLAVHGATGPFAPLFDALKLLGRKRRGKRAGMAARIALVALPLVGSAVFLALFAAANPLIADALARIALPSPIELLFWIVALLVVWPALRPRAAATAIAAGIGPQAVPRLPIPLASVLLSLVAFNAVFAVENALDLAFLWSGAALPAGTTLAGYAHRGAYPLIATALLAGLFVLVVLRPGSATAERPGIRRLVVLWVAQNVLLVASSILRTCDYIAVYMLTAWRIAALAWMALVAIGLVLVCWRLLRGRSAAWLVNANALAAVAVLAATSVVDLDATAAAWNVRHAREVGGRGTALDLCQLRGLGASALVPLAELEDRPLAPAFRDRVRAIRRDILLGDDGLIAAQRDWRRWTWRDARRLVRARTLLDHRPLGPMTLPTGWVRECDGTPRSPTPPPSYPQDTVSAPDAAPLTKDPRP